MITIDRPLYRSQCEQLFGKEQLIVLTGQRRSGKSILLKLLAEHHTTLAIDFELLTFDTLQTYQDLHSFIVQSLSNTSFSLVTIDEVQNIPQWERALLSLIKEYPQVTFIVTGSNSHLLASDLTTNLRGRYSQIHIFPFSFEEYCSYWQYDRNQQSFFGYMEQGGFAGLYQIDDSAAQREWSQNLIATIFMKDIIERYSIRQATVLRELFMYLVFNAGNLTNISTITQILIDKGLVTNRNTISEYIGYLVQAYMIYPVEVYDLRGKGIFDRIMKYYPSDHSRRKLLFGSYDPGLGKVLEILVFIECLRKGWEVKVGKFGDREIDFVISKGGIKKYLQVAYFLSTPEVVEREVSVLKVLSDQYPKYILSADPIALGNIDGIECLQVWEMERIGL